MSESTAYVTASDEAVNAYLSWRDEAIEIHHKRRELVAAVGREIWLNGSGYATHIVGFERFESDKDGDLLHHGKSLIVAKASGTNKGMVVPNMRRKSGQAFAREMKDYTVPAMEVFGCPSMHVYETSRGLTMGHARIHLSPVDRVVFALWECDNAPMNRDVWQAIPLSAYYADREKYDALMAVSGNGEPA